MSALRERISRRTAVIGVMGLGYVGLAEAVEFARAGFHVIGFDVDATRVEAVSSARSYLVDLDDADLRHVVESRRLRATLDFGRLRETDAILICVPTPLSKTMAPDISHIVEAAASIRAVLRPGQLIVLESTTYPGTTSEVVFGALSGSRLKVGRDFYLCFSPERLNPGDRRHRPAAIPRVIGGITAECAEIGAMLYRQIVPETIVVSSAEAAEMVKLLENTFRAVNIGLVNELALMCRTLHLDVWEVIDAASSKPFGFMPFYPGPGLGGHCIPIDPLYLSWKARMNGFEPRFIDLAHQVNAAMPRVVASMVTDALNKRGRCVKGSRVLVLGVSYKRDVNDIRESPAVEVMSLLDQDGALLSYHDPYVSCIRVRERTYRSVHLNESVLREADCVLVLTDHTVVDYKRVVAHASIVIDTRNATAGLLAPPEKVVRL